MELNRLMENCEYQNAVEDMPGVGMFFAAELLLELLVENSEFSSEERSVYIA